MSKFLNNAPIFTALVTFILVIVAALHYLFTDFKTNTSAATLQVVSKETEVTYDNLNPTEIRKFLVLSEDGKAIRVQVERKIWESVKAGGFVTVKYIEERRWDRSFLTITVIGKQEVEKLK